jgi:SAM-dependent methyltransferase
MVDWKYYHVTHRHHTFCNPTCEATVDELGRVLDLNGKRVLDVACGHGELLARWARHYGITGVGVDLSPYMPEMWAKQDAPSVEFVSMDGADYRTDERFDVAMCLGASWIWDGFEGTLKALRRFGDVIVSGEPFWKEDPPDEYLEFLEREGVTREMFGTLDECRARLGSEPIWCHVSTDEEWDGYELPQLGAIDTWTEPVPEIRALAERNREAYLKWGKRYLGWAIWVAS